VPKADRTLRWELVPASDNTLTVRFLTAHLHSNDLKDLMARLRGPRFRGLSDICFDLAPVEELVGPWGVHFALLIKLARDMSMHVHLNGLHGQPAALAWIFRSSPEVRVLLKGTSLRS